MVRRLEKTVSVDPLSSRGINKFHLEGDFHLESDIEANVFSAGIPSNWLRSFHFTTAAPTIVHSVLHVCQDWPVISIYTLS